jgi:hypothetical protein
MIGIIDTLFTQFGTTGNYRAIADLHTLQFVVAHALGFSVFPSRILATVIAAHMKSSLYSLIPFLTFLLNFLRLPFQELDPVLVPLLPSSHPGRLAPRSSTDWNDLLVLFISRRHGLRRKHSLSIVEKACLQRRCMATKLFDCYLRIRCRGNVFTEQLSCNRLLLWFHYSDFRAPSHIILR